VLENAKNLEFGVGFGEGRGADRVECAAKKAIEPFAETEAERMLISIVTGDAGLSDLLKAVEIIMGITVRGALVHWARRIDESLGDAMQITVIAGSSRSPD